jgi:hypothetical protein
MTLYLADTEQTKTQTFTAIYWPQQKALHLFTDEFRLERRLQGLGLGSWITQQFVLWARGLPPATLVLPIEISRVDEENEENKIRRDRLWHAMGFRFPAGNQLNAAAGRRTAVAAGQVFNAPGGAPGIRGTPAGRLLSRAAGKIVQLEGKKRSQKQLITSLKNRPFYHLLHRKGASSRTRNVTPCRCGQKNCLCRRAGFRPGGGATGNRGHPAGYPVCSVAEKNPGAGKGACLAK